MDTIKAKMNSLLSSFRREKALKTKMKTLTGKGTVEVYTGSWFAYASFSFLLDNNKPRKTLNTDKTKLTEEEYSNTDDIDKNEGDTADPTDLAESTVLTSESVLNPVFVAPKAKRSRKEESKEDHRVQKAFDIMEKSIERDAAEVYSHTFSIVQHLINNTLFNADMGKYKSHNTQTTNQLYRPILKSPLSSSDDTRSSYSHSPSPNLNITQFLLYQSSTPPSGTNVDTNILYNTQNTHSIDVGYLEHANHPLTQVNSSSLLSHEDTRSSYSPSPNQPY